MNTSDTFHVDDFVDESAVVGVEVIELHDIDFVEDEDSGFVGEEWFDGVEELALRENVGCQLAR